MVTASLAAVYLACGSTPAENVDAGSNPDTETDVAEDAVEDVVDTDVVEDSDPDTAGDVQELDTTEDTPDDVPFEWDPPFGGFGEPGWMDSTEPICDAGEMGRAVWADERGVFSFALDGAGGLDLVLNSGTGWEHVAPSPSESPFNVHARILRGSTDGLIWTIFDLNEAYQTNLETGEATASGPERVVAIESNLSGDMFALLDGAPGLVTYDGTSWTPESTQPVPFIGQDLTDLAVAADIVVIGGENGTVLTRALPVTADTSWTTHEVGTIAKVSAMWAFSADDIWVSFAAGREEDDPTIVNDLLHFDGNTWTNVPWPSGAEPQCDGVFIRQFWGVDDELFFTTQTTFGRIVDGVPELIADWSGQLVGESCGTELRIGAMWGRSADEVFLSLVDSPSVNLEPECYALMVHWDGDEFHWF